MTFKIKTLFQTPEKMKTHEDVAVMHLYMYKYSLYIPFLHNKEHNYTWINKY